MQVIDSGLQGVKAPLAGEGRRRAAMAWLNVGSRVPWKTCLEVNTEKKESHEIASTHNDLGSFLHRDDYPQWLRDHQNKQLRGIAKAAPIDLVATSEKDEVEHCLRVVNLDVVVAVREIQNMKSNDRVSNPFSGYWSSDV